MFINNSHWPALIGVMLMSLAVQAEIARVRAEAAAEVEAAAAKVSSLVTQLAGSHEFVERKDALERQIHDLKAALAAQQRETEQVLRCAALRPIYD